MLITLLKCQTANWKQNLRLWRWGEAAHNNSQLLNAMIVENDDYFPQLNYLGNSYPKCL